jgi:hypothetical protein
VIVRLAKPNRFRLSQRFADLARLLGRFEAAGTELVEMVLADGDSWDRYGAGQSWTLHQWLDRHISDAIWAGKFSCYGFRRRDLRRCSSFEFPPRVEA